MTQEKPMAHTHHPHHHPHGHDSRGHAHGEPFTAAEIERFQAEDRHAARAIITLMMAVFSLGFVGSLVIAIVVSG
jgi:hypothetical protein